MRLRRRVSITEHVIASIAGMAASGVEGISGLHGNVADNLKVFLGDERGRRGVTAHVQDDVVSVTLYVSVEYGYPIQDVARTLQSHVKREIETMTGLHVLDVNVYVSDLTLPAGSWPDDEAPSGLPHAAGDAARAADESTTNGDEAQLQQEETASARSARAQESRERP